METKKFTKTFIAIMKRTAQNAYPLTRRKNKVVKEIEELQMELDALNNQINLYQQPVIQLTGGYTTDDLIIRTVVDTGKKDKDGNSIKQVKWDLKYPDTVVPPVQETPVGEPSENVGSTQEEENPFYNYAEKEINNSEVTF